MPLHLSLSFSPSCRMMKKKRSPERMRVCMCVRPVPPKKVNKKSLPLFIKPQQIQLAHGLPPNPINLLSCESSQQHCQYLISPATDKIGSRYSMGFTSAQSHRCRDLTATVCGLPYLPSLSLSLSMTLLLSRSLILSFCFPLSILQFFSLVRTQNDPPPHPKKKHQDTKLRGYG